MCFKQVCKKHKIKHVPTTVKNPQLNAISKRIHKTILDILRITMQTTEIKDEDDARQIIDDTLATMMHATQCSVNHTLQKSSGELIF